MTSGPFGDLSHYLTRLRDDSLALNNCKSEANTANLHRNVLDLKYLQIRGNTATLHRNGHGIENLSDFRSERREKDYTMYNKHIVKMQRKSGIQSFTQYIYFIKTL